MCFKSACAQHACYVTHVGKNASCSAELYHGRKGTWSQQEMFASNGMFGASMTDSLHVLCMPCCPAVRHLYYVPKVAYSSRRPRPMAKLFSLANSRLLPVSEVPIYG